MAMPCRFALPRQLRTNSFVSSPPLIPTVRACRQRVEQASYAQPVGHKAIHDCDKLVAVGRFKQMNHLVQNDIFETLFGLLREFGIETYATGKRVAATPLSFHVLHVELPHGDVEPWFPRGNQRRNRSLEELAIPACEHRPSCRIVCARADTQA